MALSKPVIEDHILACTLCSEPFKSPKILPCLHTFCEQCLINFLESISVNKEEPLKYFKCPECRTKIRQTKSYTAIAEWVSDFPLNVLVTLMLAQRNGDNVKCCACERFEETSDATVWCGSCMEALCDACEKMHSRMKLSKDHKVEPISDVGIKNNGMDFRAIFEHCPYHPNKELDHFCMDHDQICCSFCISSTHQKCGNATPIVYNSEYNKSFIETLSTLKNETKTLLDKKKQQKANLLENVENAKENGTELLEALKTKLDACFDLLKKEVNILYEEENMQINVSIRLLEQLMKSLTHWIDVAAAMETNTTDTQTVVVNETIKEQLKVSIGEISAKLSKQHITSLKFEADEELGSYIESLERLGSVSISKCFDSEQMKPIQGSCLNANVPTIYCPAFDDLNVEYLGSISSEGNDILCGISLNERHLIIGVRSLLKEANTLNVIDKESGTVHDNFKDPALNKCRPKSFCFDKDSSHLIVSCHSNMLGVVEIEGSEIKGIMVQKNIDTYLGGISYFDNCVYLIKVNSLVRFQFPIAPSDEAEELFPTKTDAYSLGLDTHQNHIYFSSMLKDVRCSAVDGTEIFSHKSPDIVCPRHIKVLQSGVILVVDMGNEVGKLHAISADGQTSKIILQNFKNVTKPSGFWFDTDGMTFYVCGGENVDVYRIF